MANERDAQLAPQLTKMSDDEVRRQFDPSIQPVPILRTLAVTEMEKRRQKRMGAVVERSLSAGKVVVWVSASAAVAGAVVLYFSALIDR